VTRELRLGEFLLGLGETEIGEDVAAAGRHRDAGRVLLTIARSPL
jgi:hypothetical protein